MCVGFYALEDPSYALILCTNRDENLSRPTSDAHWHNFGGDPYHEPSSADEPARVLSGRDVLGGGTWFGLNTSGRVALLTNISETPGTYHSSRGFLVSSFLLSSSAHPLEDELRTIVSPSAEFAGFNLLLLAPAPASSPHHLSFDASFVSNGGGLGMLKSRALSADERVCGGLSNGIVDPDVEAWPKVTQGIQALRAILNDPSISSQNENELVERLFDLLSLESPNSQSRPHTIQVPPEPADGGTFYATRLSTVVLIRRDGHVKFVERDVWVLDEQGAVVRGERERERRFEFALGVGVDGA